MYRTDVAARLNSALKAFAVMMAMALVLSMAAPGLAAVAYADDDTIYETWSDYSKANGTDGVTWNMVANEIDKLIDGAYKAYEQGDGDTAYHYINDCGYYGWYETTGFERTVQGAISGARVSEVELAFSTARSTAKNGGSLEEFKSECDNLSRLLHEDANILDGVSGDTSGAVVDLGYEPDDVVYETWNDFKAARPEVNATWNVVANEMDKVIDHAYEAYERGDGDQAYHLINDCGYYGWYETTGFERTVQGAISGSRVSEVELAFSTTRSTAKNGGSLEEFKSECDHLKSLLHTDANILDGVDPNATTSSSDSTSSSAIATVGGGYGSAIATFIAAFGIIVREGIEAILVIGAIIAYLVKSGNKKYLKHVYIGAVLGIVCSFIAAGILTATLAAGQAPQELVEGFTALFAVVVLFWVSNWMLSKSESKAWDNYIKRQVESSVTKGSVFALAFTAWLAVFREGAEVILFYQPLLNGDYPGALWAGFGVGCIVIAVIFVLMRFFSVRLPLKPFFLAMSILMFVMCIAFLGSGIKELIEGGLISATNLGWFEQNEILNILGIYPIAQTLFPQIALTIITVITFIIQIKRNREIAAKVDEDAESGNDSAPTGDGSEADNASEPGDSAAPKEGMSEA